MKPKPKKVTIGTLACEVARKYCTCTKNDHLHFRKNNCICSRLETDINQAMHKLLAAQAQQEVSKDG